MGFSPMYDPMASTDVVVGANDLRAQTAPRLPRVKPPLLRVGGYTLDVRGGSVQWRGAPIALSARDRELLGIFLRRAGQIISGQALAQAMHESAEVIEARVLGLRRALEHAGVAAVPRRAEGLGYILWR